MNAKSLHYCRLLRAGFTVMAMASLALAPIARATEQLTNWSFSTPGGAGWLNETFGTWAPFAIDGQVYLYRSYPGTPVKILWQVLDISNVGGASVTASVVLKRDQSFFEPGAAISTKVYLEYLDGSITKEELLLSPDNYEVPIDEVGKLFTSAPFTLPAGATITGFNVYRTWGGPFYALEFSLDLQPAAPPSPVIGVTNGETALTSGGDPVWLGQNLVGVPAPAPVIFTVTNTGTGPLSLADVIVSGADAGDFEVTQPAVNSVLPQENTTFSVTFTPRAAGNRQATLLISSNDTPHSPFNINLSGEGMTPWVNLSSPPVNANFAGGVAIPLEATVETWGASISKVEFYAGETLIGEGLRGGLYGDWRYTDGSQVSVRANENGNTVVDYSPPSPEDMYFFEGQNTPAAPLQFFGTLATYMSSGNGGVDFNFGANNTLDTSIFGMVLGEPRTLTGGVCLNPKFNLSWPNASVGPHILTVRAYYGTDLYVTSDPVTIDVVATPVIVVKQPSDTILTSGTSTIDFGASIIGVGVPVTFTLENAGLATLENIVITKDETYYAGDFVVTPALIDPIAANGSTTFTVTLTPSAACTLDTVLHIASNDTTQTPFNINLTGVGMELPSLSVTDPLEAATFTSGATIPLVAKVANSGAGVTSVEFYDNATTLIGEGQRESSVYGRWYFPDGSSLGVSSDGTRLGYTPPFSSGEQMYMIGGTLTTTPLAFTGTFTHFPGPSEGAISIVFTLDANNILQAAISGDSPLGTRTLTGGICDTPKYSLSWPDAAAGSHAITARSYYGPGLYVNSAPVNITVEAPVTAIVINGDFETGALAPWPVSGLITADAAHSGQYGLELNSQGQPTFASQDIQTRLTADTLYKFTAWINIIQFGEMQYFAPFLSVNAGTSSVSASATNDLGLGWQKLEVTRSFTAAELQDTVTLFVGGPGQLRIDDISGEVAAVVPTGYAAWVLANFSAPEQSQGLAAPTADPEGRGVSNQLRYALGLTPRNPQLSLLPRYAKSSVNPAKSALEFDIPAPPPTGVEYFFGISSDLQTWTETALGSLTPEYDQTTGGRRFIRVVAPDPAPGQTRRFMTLVVRKNP
jgi:hypothetical protein